ncbi:hypothetical protein A2997_02470 [Candidatus Nomurabacteria bacterium RIFCSPLOWO2_01_FULL_36_10b]|uniref:Uncharacterized protein n=1 Tax=Candidatus Nomurabacteria bacterium RIFCSPLOWO2_01_FULL_36_10b TaxID=1801766 RepID=A0A1F6WN88_9BACT|nr:MAG: hypothetical protein A2997_02470 [Candidatus Nomurabacteria bacterium RIFCSPLOWO2_01_FULL_36_10b]
MKFDIASEFGILLLSNDDGTGTDEGGSELDERSDENLDKGSDVVEDDIPAEEELIEEEEDEEKEEEDFS